MTFEPKKLKFKKLIYPVISGTFIIIIVVVFIYAADFLATALNKAFVVDDKKAESLLIKIDMSDFQALAKKLGISAVAGGETVVPEPVIVEQATTTPAAATSTVKELDKKAVKIAVYNSTAIKGLASEFKTVIEADGFIIGKIGNTSPALATTTIKIKASKKDYSAPIRQIVSQKYQLTDDEALNETEDYDIIIVIGSK